MGLELLFQSTHGQEVCSSTIFTTPWTFTVSRRMFPNLLVRTIVGAERGKKTGKIYLLIFDPAHIGPRLKNALKVDISEDGIFLRTIVTKIW